MNTDQFKGKWTQLKGTVKEKWGKLTDNDITQINGKQEILLGKIQERYGYAKEKAEKELKAFFASFSNDDLVDEGVASKRNRNIEE